MLAHQGVQNSLFLVLANTSWPDQVAGLSLTLQVALTFHWGGQGGDSRLRVTEVHLLVQTAQCMEGGVCVLLYKQVPSIDLVDHDDFYGDTIRQHELEERKRQPTLYQLFLCLGYVPRPHGKSMNWHSHLEHGTQIAEVCRLLYYNTVRGNLTSR